MFVAKKKASSKKSNVKKVVKKAAPKTKNTSKKTAKKTAPAKKAKVTGKKAVAPKAKTKTIAKKASVKTSKNTLKTAAKKPSAKVAGKKETGSKKNGGKAKAPAAISKLMKPSTVLKQLELAGVTPLDDRLIVKATDMDRKTAGGLYIPDTVADTSGNFEGTVVAIGRGHMNKKGFIRGMDVKVGDRVVFPQYAGSKINIQNEDLVILRESDVMGVVSK
ncbi:MAG: co-chaperone GroES [Bdellovibrio sp.]